MGGFDTAISDETTEVLVESAWFNPRSVARTARALALRTDASHRFERGADTGMTLFAADRLAALLAELGGGRVLAGAIDVRALGVSPGQSPAADPRPGAGRRRFTPAHREDTIVLRTDRAAALIGAPVTGAASRLASLSISAEPSAGGTALRCHVPTWRTDLTLEVDLIEECARLAGYDTLPSTLPAIPPPVPREGAGEAEDRARLALAGFGYREVITYSMLQPGDDARFGALARAGAGLSPARGSHGAGAPRPSPAQDDAASSPLVIANPLSDRWAVMRRSLLPGVAGALAYNLAHGREDLRLFEVASVHGAGSTPYEARAAVVGAAGLAHDPASPRPLRPFDLLDLTGAIESLVAALTGRRAALAGSGGGEIAEPLTAPGATPACVMPAAPRLAFVPAIDAGPFHPPQSFVILWDGACIGRGGRLSSEVETAIESDRPIFLAEVLLEPFLAPAAPIRFRPLSRLNPVARDLSFFVPRTTAFASVEEALAQAVKGAAGGPAGAPGYTLIDRFEGKSVPEGRVSYAFRFRFVPRERALTAEEINGAIEKIAADLTAALGAEIRSR
jgi:phenylalanyl-tRNA synthetase beta chain